MRGLMNPLRLERALKRATMWCGLGGALALMWGWYAAWGAPEDVLQGGATRLMFVHVPAAWSALWMSLVLATLSVLGMATRWVGWDVLARGLAPTAALMGGLTLLTGSLWGRPVWGVWWAWDARLASMLVLFVMCLGYVALCGSSEDWRRGTSAARIWALAGAVNVPVVKFSVDWWRTLHQPASVLREGGLAMGWEFLGPLLWTALAYGLLGVGVWSLRARVELRRLAMWRASLGGSAPSAAREERAPSSVGEETRRLDGRRWICMVGVRSVVVGVAGVLVAILCGSGSIDEGVEGGEMKRGILLLCVLGATGLAAAVVFTGKRDGSARLEAPRKEAPEFTLTRLEGVGRESFSREDLKNDEGELTAVNFWASWCGPCRAEHPLLEELSRVDGIRLYGINFRDDEGDAARFLGTLGNPYDRLGSDEGGKAGLAFGVLGVPETFVFDSQGRVMKRFFGPLTEGAVAEFLSVEGL